MPIIVNLDVFNGGDDGNAEKIRAGLTNQELGLGIDSNTIINKLNEGETNNVEFNITLEEGLENKNYEFY